MERVGEVGREADFQLAPGAAKTKAAFSQVEQGGKKKTRRAEAWALLSVEADKLGNLDSQRQDALCSGWQK